MPHRSFTPIGLPRDATAGDSLDQRVGLHLLETLDALDAVYKSAACFAKVEDESAIGEFALQRCLDTVAADQGALFLVGDAGLSLAAVRGDAQALIRIDELSAKDLVSGPCLFYGPDADRILVAGNTRFSVLTSPIHVGQAFAGLVVVLSAQGCPFSTGDAKLIASVASQAAIALGRARNLRQVQAQRQQLELVVNSHPEGIAMLDQHGNTTLCNPIARELLDGHDVHERLLALDGGFTLERLLAGPFERELAVPGQRAARVLGVRSRPCGSDGAPGIVLTVRDLTRLRREERLKRNFVSLISHKLRTPLTSLRCAIELMDGAPPAEQATFLAEIDGRTRDLAGLVDRLFQFTELLEGSWTTPGSGDLRRVGQDLAAHYADQAATRPVELVWDLAADAVAVPIPGPRLRIVLQNLIDNAIKFSGSARPWVRVASRRDGAAVVIEVEDRGPGIPASERAPVLGAFHQIDSDFTGNVQGAGIGLAIVREIVRRLGGRLDLRDAVPHGAVFELTFPLADSRP
ncbi:MAG: ATP-binding protein [Planctomycetota bacterium]